MHSNSLPKLSFFASSWSVSRHRKGPLGVLLRETSSKRAVRSYSSLPISSNLLSCRNSGVRWSNNNQLNRVQALISRRLKSRKAEKGRDEEPEGPPLGDDPPLFDKKPALWARWVFVLLAMDMIFTGASVDLVMRNWTHLVESPTPTSSQDPPSSQAPNKRYEIRPLWQRLGLATFEVLIGAAAGALILASRDRTVWRLRVKRVPVSALSSGKKLLQKPNSREPTINLLILETGSGRKKRFRMRDCVIAPGRDLSELYLSIEGIQTRFLLSMNGAKVLGASADEASESKVLKELKRSKKVDDDLGLINTTTPGGSDVENASVAELRKGFAHAWLKVGGFLKLPRDSLPQRGVWTSGPVVDGHD